METDERWLTIGDVARRTNTPKKTIEAMLQSETIPFSMVKAEGGEKLLHASIVACINDKKAGFLLDTVEPPPEAIHVPDPDGVYPGFWLTPEQALMVGQFRVKHRIEGSGANALKAVSGILQAELGKCIRTR